MARDEVHQVNVRESEAVNTVLRYLFKIGPWEGYLSDDIVEAARFLAQCANDTLHAGVRPTEIPDEVTR